jgi:hypothetical protein
MSKVREARVSTRVWYRCGDGLEQLLSPEGVEDLG